MTRTAEAAAVGRLLHDIHTEFDDITPGPQALGERVVQLLAGGDTIVLVAGSGPDGLAVFSSREKRNQGPTSVSAVAAGRPRERYSVTGPDIGQPSWA